MQDSNLVKAVWKYARSQPGLSSVTRTEIVEALRRDTPARNPEATGEDSNNDTVRKQLPNGSATSRSTSNREVIRARTTDAKIATLQDLLVAGHSGNKFMFPGIVDFPDGTRIDTRSWQEAAQKIVEWIGQHGERPPLPFKGLESRYRYFINSESMHSDRPMDYAGKVQWGDGFAYVHANQGAIEYIRSLHKLCLQAGIPPDRLRLHMMPWGNAATKPL